MTTDHRPRARRTATNQPRVTLGQALVAATLGSLLRSALLAGFQLRNERRRTSPRTAART